MAIGILLITHPNIGETVQETARSLLGGSLPTSVETLSVPLTTATEDIARRAREMRDRLDAGDGVLVLADAYGATPANIARSLLNTPNTRLVCGLNLPMLLKALNYSRLPLNEVASKAMIGGRDCILECEDDSA